MNRKLIAALLANLFVAPAVFAQATPPTTVGDMSVQGFVGIGGIFTDVSNSKDEAKLNEYQDLSDGASLNFGVTGRGDRYWLNGYGENIGRDDLFVDFRGGMYNTFKYRLYSNWLTHNFGFGPAVRTPYTNPNSADLRTTFPQWNPETWTGYSMGYDRKDTGASFEWTAASPWYVKADFNQVNWDGSKLYAASNGTSPGAGFVDLPSPVDYRSNNFNLEGGYSTKAMVFSVAALWSSFDNSNTRLTWTNPFFGNGVDTTTLPPNNDFFKLSANGALRNLPMNSTLAARFTWHQTESDADLLTQMLHFSTPSGTPPSLFTPITANTTQFNGKEENTTFSLSWTALPMAGVDTKAYYNFYDRQNKSNHVEFNSSLLNCTDFEAPVISPKPSVPCEPGRYEYTKHNFGVNGYWRFDRANRFGAGWDYWDIDREGTNYDNTTTNTFFVEWSTSLIPNSSLRAKYSYQQRRSDYLHGDAGIGPNDPIWLERFNTQFDQSDRDQNMVKVTFDTVLAPALDLGLELNWQDNDYPDTTLGRTGDHRYGIYGSLGWGDAKALRVSLFGDYEHVEQDAYHRYINGGNCGGTGTSATGPNCFDPNSPPFPAAYNWNSSNKDESWLVGLAAAYPVNDMLRLSASLLYGRNSGSADLSSQAPATVPQPLNINDYDTYKQTSLNFRADYRFTRNWEVSGGYSYQKYDWTDDQYNNYLYVIPASFTAPLNSSAAYFSGLYANPNYEAHIVWVMAKFLF